MANYQGDFEAGQTVYVWWNTSAIAGESITRAVNGTVSVYKDADGTQSIAGVSDVEDADGLTGVHRVAIDTSADAFYETGADYSVVLSAATIDGKVVNAALAQFSIENRSLSIDSSWIEDIENLPDAVVDEIVARDIEINVAYVGPLSDTGVVTVYQDTDYHLSDDTQLRIPSTNPANYTGGTPYLQFGNGISWAGSVVSGGSAGDWDFDFTPSITETAGSVIAVGGYPAEIRVLKSSRTLPPPWGGTVSVVRNL